MEQTTAVSAIPDGYSTIAPYLIVDGAQAVITFLKGAFGAEVIQITHGPMGPDGNRLIGNAEVRVGNSMIMVADAREGAPAQKVMLYLYFKDVDAVHAKALAAEGVEMMPPMDMFYGDRHGGIIDPAGNSWFIASRIEDVDDDELQRRADAHHGGH